MRGDIMDDKAKAFERFKANAQELKVAHRGQCAKCEKNLTYETCKAWRIKPNEFITDEKKCPQFAERN